MAMADKVTPVLASLLQVGKDIGINCCHSTFLEGVWFLKKFGEGEQFNLAI